jgi:hypothetical protein
MGKIKAIQIAIVMAVLVIVLPLAFTSNNTYSGSQSINWNNASKALTFNLNTGQTVNGYFSLNNNERTSYIVYNDEVGEIIVSRTNENKGNFTFTAKSDGPYYLNIYYDIPFGNSMGYSYNISSTFLGFHYILWIGLVIVIGLILELIVTLTSIYKKKSKISIG